jgi:hypothetical protein
MRNVFIILLFAQGLIHLMGFAQAFELADLRQIKGSISRSMGVLWLAAAVLFGSSAMLVVVHNVLWWIPCLTALGLSQVVIVRSWSDAKYGTVINILLAVSLAVPVANTLPSSFASTYRREVEHGLTRLSAMPPLRRDDIRHLPVPVQRYLIYTGSVGKPRLQNVRATFTGQMQTKTDGAWIDITARQYDFFDKSTRVFFIESTMYGIPFDGLHLYAGQSATMQIRLASLIQVVDARGPEMTRGETVTLFNDMCLLAPASLIDPRISWETIDSLNVDARFTNAGNTIGARLCFNDTGELTDFTSNDRYLSSDGKVYLNYRWSTPVGAYRDFQGYRLASYGEAIWHTPAGDLTYAKFNLHEVEFNCTEYK